MIELADLPIFLAVARSGSFVTASRKTKTPPSTTSRAVARLERALGVRLFERTSRRVVLTEAGADLLARAGTLTDTLAGVLDDVSTRNAAPSGKVRVTATLWVGAGRVARALVRFAAKHPRITVDLQLSNTVVDLVDAGFDLALRAGPITDPSLVARRLWEIPFGLGASPTFVRRVLGGKHRVSLTRLADIPAITTTGGAWTFRAEDGTTHSLTPLERFRANAPQVAIDAAVGGLGIVRAPAAAIVEAGLVPITCSAGTVAPRSVYAVFPSTQHLPKRVRLVVDWIARDAG